MGYDLNVYPESLEYLQIKKNPSEDFSIQLSDLYLDISSNRSKLYHEVNSFLKWISREWKVEIEDLSGKSYLKEYWKNGFDESSKSLLSIAKDNKSIIGIDPSSRKFQERMEEEWQSSVDKLNPIISEISKLENQMNALVFRLYGFNEDEISLVLDFLETEYDTQREIMNEFKMTE